MTQSSSTASASSTGPQRVGRGGGKPRAFTRQDILPYALVTPLTIFIVGLALVPAAYTIIKAFFRVQPLNPPEQFSGLENFRNILADPTIMTSFGNTVLYVFVGVGLSTVLAIGMAVTLQKKFAGRSMFIAILILPWALPGVVQGIVWGSLWDSNTGLFNSLLTSMHFIDHYMVFLGQNRFATIAGIELVQVWQITPLSALLILATLQNIPHELYEAAALDGCTPWQTFRRVTLQLARPGITVAMVQAIIATINIFDQPYILNGSASTGASLTMQTYFISFQNLDFGEGYALSLLITLATLVASFVVLKLVYRSVEY
jgi:multiple sugar transport system permease protein